MSREPEHQRLCRLVHQALTPYTNYIPSSTKEIERDLLISLSQVFGTIKQWTKEYQNDSDSENDDVARPISRVDCSTSSKLHLDDHHCLTSISNHLTALLAVENPFIQHLTGNILVAIHEFMDASETDWGEFIRILCLCLKLAIDKCLSAHLGSVTSEDKVSNFDLTVLNLKGANFSIPAAITRVLRNVFKLLKRDFSDHILEVYLDSINSVILEIPWTRLNEVFAVQSGQSVGLLSGDMQLDSSNTGLTSMIIFQGNLLQFFCSLVDNNRIIEPGAVSDSNQLLLSSICNIIPDLLAWCLREQEKSDNFHTSHYFRHKILILLIRLTSQDCLDFDVLSSWLHLIWKYFHVLLRRQIVSLLSHPDDCLEGSPFWLHALNSKRDCFSYYHLQRLVVFVLLRCSFSLISMKEKMSETCACENPECCLAVNSDAASNCCNRRKGLLELHRWLQGQLPDDIYEESGLYSARCISFATSFLRLYINEDDILFEMLLLLCEVPIYSDRCIVEDEAFRTAKTNMFYLVSDIFNPIYIFHIFLSEILYDHQVLLDYLISKDSGASSAEYLLRGLRIICTSWNLFLEFPKIEETSAKRRKISADCAHVEFLSSPLSINCDGFSPTIVMKCKKGHQGVNNHGRSRRLSFEDAKACLIALKTSIESLNQKNLFPYNPQVLLKRLAKFQELCLML